MALERTGGRCVFSSEWNKYSRITYYENFNEWPEGDITKIRPRKIPDHDVLAAGFPCQPFSIAGISKKVSMNRPVGFDDEEQGTLFFNVRDIIRQKRPAAVLLENVKNLMTHDKGNTFKVITKSLENEFWHQEKEKMNLENEVLSLEKKYENIDEKVELSLIKQGQKRRLIKDLIKLDQVNKSLKDKLKSLEQKVSSLSK